MRTPVQQLTYRVAGAFLLLAVLGCAPGLTAHLGEIPLTGPGGAALLGLIPVTVAGNILHVTAAAAGAVMASTPRLARAYLLATGAGYSVLCLRSIAVGTGASNPHVDGDAGLWLTLSWGLLVLVFGLVVTGAGELRPWARPVPARPDGWDG